MTDQERVLYHGTSRADADGILAGGLLTEQDRGLGCPTEAEFDRIDEPYLWDGVWCTTDLERAEMFGDVVLIIDARGIAEERVFERFDEDVCIVGSIGASLIAELTRQNAERSPA